MRRACGSWAWYHPEKGLSQWFCGGSSCEREHCRGLYYHRRIRLLSALVEQYDLIRFFTLTLDPKFVDGDPWDYVKHPWSKMRKRMNRLHPGWRYVAVLERHAKRDVPHIHGFTDVWMEQREWSRHWHESCGGSVVWIEKVDTADASAYVSKQLKVANYVGKDCLVAPYHAGKQRRTLWRSSHTKANFELDKQPGWRILDEGVYGEDGELTSYGKRLERRLYGS